MLDDRTLNVMAEMADALRTVESRYSTKFGEYCICDYDKVSHALKEYLAWSSFAALQWRRENEEIIDLEPEQPARRALPRSSS